MKVKGSQVHPRSGIKRPVFPNHGIIGRDQSVASEEGSASMRSLTDVCTEERVYGISFWDQKFERMRAAQLGHAYGINRGE